MDGWTLNPIRAVGYSHSIFTTIALSISHRQVTIVYHWVCGWVDGYFSHLEACKVPPSIVNVSQ